MTDYTEKALEWIPEVANGSANWDNPMQLWIELCLLFEHAYEPPRNDSLIKRIYKFAGWCIGQPQHTDVKAEDDLFTAVCYAFLEEIPLCPEARKDMPRWFTVKDLSELEDIFRYHLIESEFDTLKQYIADNQPHIQRERWLPIVDIQLVDVSARDGLQNEPNAAALSGADKVDYIIALAKTGLKRIEAGSFVHPKVAAMANSGEVAEKLKAVQGDFPDVIFSYLVPNLKGLERAKAVNAKEIAIFLAVSEKFSIANINQSVESSFHAIKPVIDAARAAGMRVRGYLSTIFGYDDLLFSPAEVARRAKQLLDMGCYEVSLGDTTGIGKPEQVAELIAALAAQLPLSKVAMHFHDTFGNAIGNVDTSYDLGIRTFDAATGGLGGCPYANSPKGNLAMEDLVRWCSKRKLSCDVADINQLIAAGRVMLKKLGKAYA